MKRTFLAGALAAAALSVSAAHADIIINSPTLGPGDSQSFQVGGGNLGSSIGAAAQLNITLDIASNSTGSISVTFKNTGSGVIDVFGLSLKDSIFSTFTPASTLMTNVSCTDVGTPSGNTAGCGFTSGGTNSVKGFLDNHLSVGASANSPTAKQGLAAGEQATFTWTVTGNFAGFTAATPFSTFEQLETVSAGTGDQNFDSFWVAHVISLTDGDSDKIGGGATTNTVSTQSVAAVPEPASLSLFGLGLILLTLRLRPWAAAAARGARPHSSVNA
jgi:hypothetical protein